MKKYFLSIVALAGMLFATSCQESLVEPQVGGPTTFTVQVPDAMGTKAIGEASSVNTLYVAVYDQATSDAKAIAKVKTSINNGEATVKLNLIQGVAYDIVFWAQYNESYVNSTSELITIDVNQDFNNSEDGAVFYAYKENFVPNGTSNTVTLTRPFAQLNLGTTPESLVTAVDDEVEVISTSLQIKDVATKFVTVSGLGENTATRTLNTTGLVNEDLTVNGTTTPYKRLSMDYLTLVDGNKTVVDVVATIKVKEGGIERTIVRELKSVPVMKNARTNIVGNLISSTTDFNVVVDDRFVDENNTPNPDNDYFVVDNVGAAESAFEDGETHVAINYIVDGGDIDILSTAAETLYLQLPDVNAEFTVNVPQQVKKLNIAVPNTDESNVGLNLIVNAPYSTVDFTGQAAMITSTTAPNTLNLNGAEVGTIIVKKGNVVVENDSQVVELDNQSGGEVTVYVDNSSQVTVPENEGFNKIEEPEIIDTYEALQNALTYSSDVVLTNDITLSEILVIQRRDFIFDGNGYTLKSTAGRAINVSGADGVTIKNLTIECSGERAINIIQNATNVTIENVTATAANYTVNVAGSAPNAIVNITNSTLNGLCTVNVSGEEAEVYVNNSTVNCNDNNTTHGESYAALCLIKDAVGGKIEVTNSTINVTEGSDSYKARNGAEDGIITIDGSDDEVSVTVAFITFEGQDSYYGYASLDKAFEDAQKYNRPVTLIRNITVEEPIVIEEGQTVVLDLNGKTIFGTMPKSVGAVVKNNGTLTIQNGTISSTAANGGSPISNYGTLNVKNATINGASKRENESWPSYPVNNYSDATFENVLVNGYQGAIACNAAGTTTLTECTINKEYLNTSSHVFYIDHADAKVVVNSGTYTHKGMDGSLAYVIKGRITVNGGTFSASNGGYGMASKPGGIIEVNGGDFTTSFMGWGGTINIKGGTFASKPKEDFIADGYEAVAKGGKYYVVEADVAVVTTADELVAALEGKKDVLFANDIKIDPANMSNAYGKTGINVKDGQTIDGNGYTLNIKGAGGTWDSGINTTGGLIKNITVTGSFRGIFINHNSDHSEKVVLENVTIGGNGTVYTISCDQGLYQGIEATNCTFNGWTSFAETAGEAKFVNCNFGEGSGYKYCRPYSNTEFVNCTFCPGYAVDRSEAEVTFTNCTWEE